MSEVYGTPKNGVEPSRMEHLEKQRGPKVIPPGWEPVERQRGPKGFPAWPETPKPIPQQSPSEQGRGKPSKPQEPANQPPTKQD
jgi:hypothetical protein